LPHSRRRRPHRPAPRLAAEGRRAKRRNRIGFALEQRGCARAVQFRATGDVPAASAAGYPARHWRTASTPRRCSRPRWGLDDDRAQSATAVRPVRGAGGGPWRRADRPGQAPSRPAGDGGARRGAAPRAVAHAAGTAPTRRCRGRTAAAAPPAHRAPSRPRRRRRASPRARGRARILLVDDEEDVRDPGPALRRSRVRIVEAGTQTRRRRPRPPGRTAHSSSSPTSGCPPPAGPRSRAASRW
jgi:hypothetical protein